MPSLNYALTTLTIVGVTLCATTVSAISGTWLAVNAVYTPRDKFGMTCTAASGNATEMIVFGGREATPFTNSIYRYNTTAAQWTQLFPVTDSVPGTAAMAIGRVGNVIWIFGGLLTGDAVATATYAFNLGTSEWKTPSVTGDVPSGRRRLTSWIYNNTLVIFGGQTGAYTVNDVYALDTTTLVWSLWANTGPTARFDPCCAVVPGATTVVCFGGTTAESDVNDVWEFDNALKTWQQRNTSGTGPGLRRLAMCTIVGGEFLAWGGWDSAAGEFTRDTNLYLLNLTTNTWRSVTQNAKPDARDSGAMCTGPSDGRVFLLGGSSNSGRSNEVFELNRTTNVFETKQAVILKPTGRAMHSSVVDGTDMYVMFGYDGSSYLNDVWKYSTLTDTWSKVTTSGTAPVGRRSACVAMRGSVVYVYGGTGASGELEDMYTLNLDTRAWKAQQMSGTTPGRRAEASCWFHDHDVLVLGLGTVTSSGRDTQWFAYRVTDQYWRSVTFNTTLSYPASRSSSFGFSINGTHAMVGLGIGVATYNDRWIMSPLTLSSAGTSYSMTWTKLDSTIPSGDSERRYLRGESAVAGINNNVLICGGALSSSFPASEDNVCFLYNAITGANTPVAGAAFSTSGASAVYVGNTVYIFGGRLGSATIKRNYYLNTLQRFRFDTMCAANSSNDASCMHCSAGTTNPTCTAAPLGTYSTLPYNGTSNCGVGEYQNQLGASSEHYCIKCAAGTYNPTPGAASCLACTTSDGCPLGSSVDTSTSAVPPIHVSVSQPGPLKSLLPPWPLVLILSGCIIFFMALALFYIRQFMGIHCRNLDIFDDGHRPGHVNTEIRIVKTTYGGVVGVFAIIAMIALVAILITGHFYDNITEVKSAAPRTLIESRFASLDIYSDIDVLVTVAGPTREVSGTREAKEHCLMPDSTNTCRGMVAFIQALAHIGNTSLECSYNPTYGSCTMRAMCTQCGFTTGGETNLRLQFAPGLSAAYIDYEVRVSTGIRTPKVYTFGKVQPVGPQDELSVVTGRLSPPSGTVFSGYPQSSVYMDLTPTYFISPTSILKSATHMHLGTGYHATQPYSNTAGNTVDPYSFNQFFGVPIDIVFGTQVSSELVERSLRVSEAELISSILGSVSGIVALALIFVKVMDKQSFKDVVRKCCGDRCQCLTQDLDDYAEQMMFEAIAEGKYHPYKDKRKRRLEHMLHEHEELDEFVKEIEFEKSKALSAVGSSTEAVIVDMEAAPGVPQIASENEEGKFDSREPFSRVAPPVNLNGCEPYHDESFSYYDEMEAARLDAASPDPIIAMREALVSRIAAADAQRRASTVEP
jgi:N-acetylneuraminic acid mutarotase